MGGTDTFSIGAAQLERLCAAAGLAGGPGRPTGFFRELAPLCRAGESDRPPRWSAVAEDCTPFEFSIAIRKGGSDLRVLVEAQDDPASPLSYWAAGLRLSDWLHGRGLVDLSRFRAIEDLFVPAVEHAIWAMWHAFEFRADGRMLCKLYLNSHARGRDRAEEVVAAALERLGFARAWPAIRSTLGPGRQLSFFSLDLSSGPHARVKVYSRHPRATFREIDDFCRRSGSAEAGEMEEFCRAMTGEAEAFTGRPILRVDHLNDPDRDRPSRSTIYVPLWGYAPTDRVAHDRIQAFLGQWGLPLAPHADCIRALAVRPLDEECGIHYYASFAREDGEPRVTVYFGSRVFWDRFGPLAAQDPDVLWPSPRFEGRSRS